MIDCYELVRRINVAGVPASCISLTKGGRRMSVLANGRVFQYKLEYLTSHRRMQEIIRELKDEDDGPADGAAATA